MSSSAAGPVKDGRALVAVDLGAESCRVSLLRWVDQIEPTHRDETAMNGAPAAVSWWRQVTAI